MEDECILPIQSIDKPMFTHRGGKNGNRYKVSIVYNGQQYVRDYVGRNANYVRGRANYLHLNKGDAISFSSFSDFVIGKPLFVEKKKNHKKR